MTPLAAALTAITALGGLGGLVALLRLRTDRGATIVETVSKGVLVQDRIIVRLEGDLEDERAGRKAAEAERDELRRLLSEYGPLPADRLPRPPDSLEA